MTDSRGSALSAVESVAEAMNKWLSAEHGSLLPDDLARLQQQLREGEAPDYDESSIAFAQAYHLINYWKCFAALNASAPPTTTRLLDLGCGSGAATAAALVYLATQGTRGPIEIQILDRSQAQLDLAEKLLGSLHGLLPFDYRLQALRIDLQYGQPSLEPRGGLALVAHVLTENLDNVESIFELAAGLTASDGTVLVLERPDDPVWDRMAKYLSDSPLNSTTGEVSVKKCGPDGDDRAWHARWLVHERPRTGKLAGAVRGYFDAWRSQDPQRLVSVFAENARYYAKPFRPSITGLSNIKRYWQEEVVPQAELTLGLERLAYGPSSVYVEWRARFVRDRLQYALKGAMMIDVDLDTGLIRELREYYRSAPPEDTSAHGPRAGPRDR